MMRRRRLMHIMSLSSDSRSNPSPLAVTIVAPEVGTVGGEQRAVGELVSRLLVQRAEVHVIARKCALSPHPRLRWTRIPSPARPAAMSGPMFFCLASLAAWRTRTRILHLVGPVAGNRAEVITVHFCRHA